MSWKVEEEGKGGKAVALEASWPGFAASQLGDKWTSPRAAQKDQGDGLCQTKQTSGGLLSSGRLNYGSNGVKSWTSSMDMFPHDSLSFVSALHMGRSEPLSLVS